MLTSSSSPAFYPQLQQTIRALTSRFHTIPESRKAILKQLTEFVNTRIRNRGKAELIFICTHNSRRSHISQIWAQTAAAFYNVPDVVSYSGGTEATAFNPRAVAAMQKAGFRISPTSSGDNPVYGVAFADNAQNIVVYSKRYDAESNPRSGFAAVMTCSHADENCPVVIGMEKRISLPYNDPKDFDGTPEEADKYSERVMEIGTELLYAFSQTTVAGRSAKSEDR